MTKDVDFQPSSDSPVAAWSGHLAQGAHWQAMGDDHARVMFCFDGLMRVETGAGRWFIPDRFGLWLPPGTAAQVQVAHRAEFQTLLLHPRFARRPGLPDHPVMLRATPLMRGIGRRLAPTDTATDTAAAPLTRPERRRLGWVALDEIARLDRPDLHLPGGKDARLARVMSHLLAHPGDANSLALLASRAGISTRTLSRLFQHETGLSWRDWRDRMRFVLAVEGVQLGRSSTELAAALGYSSPSAFVAAFRRQAGVSPSQWRQQK